MTKQLSAMGSVFACMLALLVAPSADAKGHGHRHDRASLGGINIGAINGSTPLSAIDAEIAAARHLHAKLVRVEIAWSQFEPDARGKISHSAIVAADRLAHDAASSHIRVIALVQSTPCWASAAPAALLRACRSGGPSSSANAWPPRSASAFGEFTGWLAKRYAKDLAAIEVWNEPDQINQKYLKGPHKPRTYAKLLRAAYKAIKHANRHVKVLAGSLVGSNGKFMEALYRAGIKGHYDGVAVHFYTLTLGALRAFRQVQRHNHDHKPLWLDEFGWSSCWPKQKIQQEQGCVTRKIQARNIKSTFQELARTRYVKAIVPYTLRDSPKEDFGVLAVNGSRKPAFRSLRKVLRSPFGKPSGVTLRLRRAGGQIVATGSGPVGDYMELEAFQHRRLRYRSLFTLNRFNRYKIKLPKVLGTKGLSVRVWQYWLGRKHAAHATT